MRERKLTETGILSIIELKKTLTWQQVAARLQVSVPLAKYYGRKLKEAGHIITKQPTIKPVNLVAKVNTKNEIPI